MSSLKRGAKTKFPNPGKTKKAQDVAFCSKSRVLNLYNESNGTSRERITKTIYKWFHSEALANGWVGVTFINDLETQHSAGCVLWCAGDTSVSMVIQRDMYVLQDMDDSEIEEAEE